jgi:hypothetical protein
MNLYQPGNSLKDTENCNDFEKGKGEEIEKRPKKIVRTLNFCIKQFWHIVRLCHLPLYLSHFRRVVLKGRERALAKNMFAT